MSKRQPRQRNAGKWKRAATDAALFLHAQQRYKVQEIVRRVQQHVAPACSFVTEYLNLLAEDVGLGGVSVYFGDNELRHHPIDKSTEDMTPDELAQLAEQTKLEIPRMRNFCQRLRTFPEGARRCWNCDIRWVRRAARTKRTHVYQCHAGLTDIVVPIVVRGEYAGRIMTGQLLRRGTNVDGFAEIWGRVKDVGALEGAELKEAYRELRSVTDAELRRIVSVLEGAARTLGDLWENITVLFEQEKQLLHMPVYLQREFAEWLVSGQNVTETEAMARARCIGLGALPTVVLVAQPDLTTAATFEMNAVQRQEVFARLLEAMHAVGEHVPNSFVTSIGPGELIMFWHLPETRNPGLRGLNICEVSDKIKATMKRSLSVPVRTGFNMNKYPADRMNEAYREARAALHNGVERPVRPAHEKEDRNELLARRRKELTPCLRELRDAVRTDNGKVAGRILEKMLTTVTRFDDQDRDLRRLLFTEMVYCFLDSLQETHFCDKEVEQLRLDYMRSFSSLTSMEEILEWFRSRLAEMVLHMEQMRRSPEEYAVAQACSIVNESLNARLNRGDVARSIGMSESHFGSVFREKTGVSFREYVQLARVAQAQRLLLMPGKCVSEVAMDVGYADISSFTRAFSRVCGTSPTEYRDSPRSYKSVTLPAGPYSP
ncbi:MAG TPA: PocR ligand-binding domain-containing protein [Candidatus Hydrogenedentes bacterium]|nr:PocR ligand-binding domain-containing protein [Candidatus Hydrogenedentota bacterium]